MASASPSGPAEGLAEALAGLLRQADGGPQPHDLADVLWIAELAGMLEPPPPPPAPPLPPSPPMPPVPRPSAAPRPALTRPKSTVVPWRSSPTPPPPPPPRAPIGPAPTVAVPPPVSPSAVRPVTEPQAALHHRSGNPETNEPGGTGRSGGHVVRVAQPAALDGGLALARALRPLRRGVDAVGRATLDEEATAEATAETGILLPVWRAAQQPRFSIDLLVDTGATMAVWHRLAGELSTLLERHGAFADVRCWALDTDRPVPTLAPFHRRRPGVPAARADWSRPLNDPTGRRILLVLTDGVGPAWYGKDLPKFLAGVAAARPAAALQVLPRRLWHRTALRTALVAARASVAGRPVPAFRSDAALPGIPPGSRGAQARTAIRWLPVLEVDADWITPWADLTAGRTSGWTPMLAAPIAGMPERQRPTRPAATPATPTEHVARFRAGSSPAAYRLACHLAAAPLSLPVMRLVQRAAVPESGQTDLAELFLSGLIAPRGGTATDPDEQVYDFRDGVRKELLAELTRTEAVDVLEHVLTKVSGRVAATFGGTRDFRAVARLVDGDEGDNGEVLLSARSMPFAEVAVTVLASAGGEHAALAARLAEAVSRTTRGETAARAPRPVPPPFRPEKLTPVRPVLSPPEPPRMIGRKRELAALAAAFASDRAAFGSPERPAVVVVVGEAGMGRRRLVQEYVAAYGERHSFTHWIDARSPGSLEQGMHRLWAALAPADELFGHTRLWALLAQHQEWLVVLDNCCSDERNGTPGIPLDLFPQRGRGCVLATTEEFTTGSAQGVTVVELGPLRTVEVLDELRARLDPAHSPDDPAQTRALEQLAHRLPNRPDILADMDLDAELARTVPGATVPPQPSPPRTSSNRVVVHATVQGLPVTLRLPVPGSAARSGIPVPSPAFTGRSEALAALLSFLVPVEPGQLPPRTAVVTGPPGVGKSELVLRAVGTALERGWYPGGALYLDLREHANTSALSPSALLHALGVPGEIVPPDPRDRFRLFETVLTQISAEVGPILLVLDNAPPRVDLAPYLPVDGAVTILATSRHSLTIDAIRLDLQAMTPEDSVQLLQNAVQAVLLGDERVSGPRGPWLALAELCDGLPLALRICADRLADQPTLPVATLVQELGEPRHRLDGLSQRERSLRVAFTESYLDLSSNESRLFRLLSVYPYPELSTDVAAGLADLDVLEAEDLMAALARAHLVGPGSTPGHWRFPPLLRLYSLSRGEANADVDDRATALDRLLTHYRLEAAAAAAGDSRETVRFRDAEQGLAWLEAEWSILVALVACAAEHGGSDTASAFTRAMLRIFLSGRRFGDLTDLAESMRAIDHRRGGSTASEWFLRTLVQALDETRIRPVDLPPEDRTAFDLLFRIFSEQKVPTNQLYLAVQILDADEAAALVLERILGEIQRASTIDSGLTRPSPGFGAQLLLTFFEPGDPLATAGRALLDLWDRIKRLAPADRPRTPIAVSVLHGDRPEHLPGADQLRIRTAGEHDTRNRPVAAVAVSRPVFDMLSDQFGTDITMRFDLLLANGVEPPPEDAAYLYSGDPQLLGLILSHPTAGRIIES
ncbi:ATP-binding protein [Kitasatospora purpeofusca]|uniref:ATP-binding protein n=1 Tax=Kitasatospora purpeofusca TaxID=67352 RepID=UPI0033E350B2